MDGFFGEIRMFPYTFAPEGWLYCNGAVYNVQDYQALFAVIGNNYGGTYPNTFAVPDMRGLVPRGAGAGPGLTPAQLAIVTGTETVALTNSQMGAHSHTMQAAPLLGNTASPTSTVMFGNRGTGNKTIQMYTPPPTDTSTIVPFAGNMLSPSGGNASGGVDGHENRQPVLVMGFYICWQGLWPYQ